MVSWRVLFSYYDGTPFGWGKDFLGKGYGSIKRRRCSTIYDWSIGLDPGGEDAFVPWDYGEAYSLEEAKRIVDEQFELVGKV